MIREILSVFKPVYQKYGDSMVFIDYKLSKGLYIKIGNDKNEYLLINDKGECKEGDYSLYNWFVARDYYSRVVNSNKVLDARNKNLAHNNIYSFICKQDFFEKLYMDNFENSLSLTVSAIKALKPVVSIQDLDQETIEQNTENLINNFDYCKKIVSESKTTGYIRIFLDAHEGCYKTEYERYTYSANKLFLTEDYMQNIYGKLMGVPPVNFSLNSKKPYLINLSMTNKIPARLDVDTAFHEIKFFDWLKWQTNEVKLYYAENEFYHIIKGIDSKGQVLIKDFDIVTALDNRFHYVCNPSIPQEVCPRLLDSCSVLDLVELEFNRMITQDGVYKIRK
jgi:hypothetical protein